MNYAPFVPLRLNSQNGYEMMTSVKQLIRFHLKNLVLTSPGEKISKPNYGVGIRRYLFEPLNESTAAIIEGNIRSQINQYLSYLNLEEVSVTSDIEGLKMSAKIKYSLQGTTIQDVTQIDVAYTSDDLTITPF